MCLAPANGRSSQFRSSRTRPNRRFHCVMRTYFSLVIKAHPYIILRARCGLFAPCDPGPTRSRRLAFCLPAVPLAPARFVVARRTISRDGVASNARPDHPESDESFESRTHFLASSCFGVLVMDMLPRSAARRREPSRGHSQRPSDLDRDLDRNRRCLPGFSGRPAEGAAGRVLLSDKTRLLRSRLS